MGKGTPITLTFLLVFSVVGYLIVDSNSLDTESSEVITFKCDDGQTIPFENNTFDRIIISHCLEHINDPEKFLLQMMDKLTIGGTLSISLPTDPGVLFRIGRLYLKTFSINKKYKITKTDFDYMNATEHINSIFGLIAIIKYHFKNSIIENYLPFKVKLPDLNLFYNVHIFKKN